MAVDLDAGLDEKLVLLVSQIFAPSIIDFGMWRRWAGVISDNS